jgi:hypothetical protein
VPKEEVREESMGSLISGDYPSSLVVGDTWKATFHFAF